MAADELDAVRQAYESTIRQQQTLVEMQSRLRHAAEALATQARQQLERVAVALCPQVADALRLQDPEGLAKVSLQDLAEAVIQDAQLRLSRLGAAEATGHTAGALYDTAVAQSDALQRQVHDLTNQLDAARQELEETSTRLAVAEQALGDAHRRLGQEAGSSLGGSEETSSGPVDSQHLPEWIEEWQRTQTHDRDVALLDVLARTGVARRTEAADLVAARLEIDPRGGGITRLFKRCHRELGLIELHEAETLVSGRATHLVDLSQKGRDACRLVLGITPVKSLATEMHRRHKSWAHALLNLEAADLLRDAGYDVDLLPGPITLPSGGTFDPDLVASRAGKPIYVEVERETRKNEDQRTKKWANYAEATGGNLYVVVPDQSALDVIRGEILFDLAGQPFKLWMTSIGDAKGRRGDDVWLMKRDRE